MQRGLSRRAAARVQCRPALRATAYRLSTPAAHQGADALHALCRHGLLGHGRGVHGRRVGVPLRKRHQQLQGGERAREVHTGPCHLAPSRQHSNCSMRRASMFSHHSLTSLATEALCSTSPRM